MKDMKECEGCGNQVDQIMKSTGTCVECRNGEIVKAEESVEETKEAGIWLSNIYHIIRELREPEVI